MPFAFGSFAGGIGAGMEQGQRIRAQQLAAQLAQLKKSAADAYSNYLSQGGTPQEAASIIGGGLGGSPSSGQPAAGGLSALSGPVGTVAGAGGGMTPPSASQVAQPNAPAPTGMAALSPQPASQPMQPSAMPAAPQPSPGPPASPLGATGPAGSGAIAGGSAGPSQGGSVDSSGGGLSDKDLSPDAIAQQGRAEVQKVAREIAAANPGRKWKHGELLEAVHMALDDQKKYIDPMAFQSAKIQLATAKAQISQAESLQKLALGNRKEDHTEAKDATDEAERQRWHNMSYDEREDAIKAGVEKAKMANQGTLSPESIKYYAELFRTYGPSALGRLSKGDRTAVINGAQSAASGTGESAADDIRTQYAGKGAQSEQRAMGTRTGQLEVAEAEMQRAIQLSNDAYSKLDRNSFVPFNQLRVMVEKGTSNPNQARAYAADNALVNIYARMISPTGQGTDSDKNHAREMLNQAQGPEAHAAVVKQLMLEGQNAREGAQEARGKATANTPVAGAGQRGQGASAQNPMRPKTKAEAAALPSGTWFMDPAGNVIQRH